MINIACVLRQGGKVGYDSTWVEKLKNSVSRNLILPHRFICLSDCKVECDRIPLTDSGRGFWSKLELFKPNQFLGPVLYIDLDTVICGNINELVNKCKNEKFVMWVERDKNIHSSALMYWNGDYSYLWDIYKSQSLDFWREIYSEPPLYGDQAIVSENVEHKTFLDLCPTEWFHIASSQDNNLDLSKVKMLMFRKVKNKPSTMSDNHLIKTHWK
jgi:hypothetical protein